mmetsp:Transcript_1860/g.3344  ORF Transcript_1860/g.3344 Transcript_1860/m.3344 type:complete len:109 (-) Transcript_1860:810-1136(-)
MLQEGIQIKMDVRSSRISERIRHRFAQADEVGEEHGLSIDITRSCVDEGLRVQGGEEVHAAQDMHGFMVIVLSSSLCNDVYSNLPAETCFPAPGGAFNQWYVELLYIG